MTSRNRGLGEESGVGGGGRGGEERKGIEEQAHHLVNGERRCEKSSVPCETNLVRESDKGDAGKCRHMRRNQSVGLW